MVVPLGELPQTVGGACRRLRDGVFDLLGSRLVALWAYGAVVFPDRPARLGDVDTHGVLADRPDERTAAAIDRLHETIATESGIEWDSWYVLEADARRSDPPHHALRANLVDDAWALHRAHWLAGRYVLLHGAAPSDLVPPPAWAELEDALRDELEYIEGLVARGRDDPAHAAFAVWNACRIMYSFATRDVVVSKRTAARWALENLPSDWHAAIDAAGHVYDGAADADDATVLRSLLPQVVPLTQARISAGM